MCTGSCSAPRQGLPGDRQGPPWFLLEPFKNKVFKSRRQGPGKRSLPGRPTTALQETCRDAPHVPARSGERQAAGLDKMTTPTRYSPGARCHSVPTLQRTHPRVAMRLPQGARGGSLCSQGNVVASGDEEKAIVANGGAPNGHFLHYLGNSDGHSMPLSPAVRVR